MTKPIIVNDRFSIERDKYGWQLYDYHMGIDKKGNPKRYKRTTYHANLMHMSRVIIDRTAGKCETLAGITEMILNAENIVTEGLERIVEQHEHKPGE